MSTALQLQTDTMADWQIIRQQAEVLVKTGFLPKSITTPEQAMAIILTGRELGIGAMAALNTINVIQGKPTISPQLMLALINRSGQVEDMAIETGKDGASCMIKRRGRQPYTARFGPAEARAMGLDGKDNYKKQPATMYKWRAVADAARATFADVLLGLHSPDEMGADTDAETGEIIEATPEPPPPADEQEPIRPVILEGVQPTDDKPSQWPKVRKYASIFGKCEALKWTYTNLVGEIYNRFKLAVNEEDPELALDALNAGQLKELDQALAAEFNNRGR